MEVEGLHFNFGETSHDYALSYGENKANSFTAKKIKIMLTDKGSYNVWVDMGPDFRIQTYTDIKWLYYD